MCGHCWNHSSCEPANGTCLQGCEPGYKTPLCIEGMEHNNPSQMLISFKRTVELYPQLANFIAKFC